MLPDCPVREAVSAPGQDAECPGVAEGWQLSGHLVGGRLVFTPQPARQLWASQVSADSASVRQSERGWLRPTLFYRNTEEGCNDWG